MSEPSSQTVKRLFALSGNRCAFPQCQSPIVEDSGIVTGRICHIRARSPEGPRYDRNQTDEGRHGFANLLLLCSRHHDIIDRTPDDYSVETLIGMKDAHEKGGRKELEPRDATHAEALLASYRSIINVSNVNGPVIINSPGAVGGKHVNVRTATRTVKVMPPEESIGSDIRLRGYAKYLIDRYNEFAADDPTRKGKFSYATIYTNIQSNFGVKWELVPKVRFDKLADYLRQRIDRTRQACINKSKGQRSYRPFEEWCREKLGV